MVPELEYRKAPEEHLRTWERITRLFLISTVSIAILLALLVQLVP